MFRKNKLLSIILSISLLNALPTHNAFAQENKNQINIDGSGVSLNFPSKIYIPKNCVNWKYTFINNGERKLSVFVIIETLGGEEISRNGSVGIDKGITQTDSIRVCDYQFPKRKKGKTYSMNLNLRIAEYNGANNIFTKKIKAVYK